MRHKLMHGFHRYFGRPDDRSGPHHPHHPHHRGHRGQRGGRLFDYGELRLLILKMIEGQPRHGYELIKAIGEQFGGSYTPSPGVIYPTLTWLDDMGYATLDVEEAGRKRYRITAEGLAFLEANAATVAALQARATPEAGGRDGVPSPVLRAMENLKTALRLRLRRGTLEPDAAEAIANALDQAAKAVERA